MAHPDNETRTPRTLKGDMKYLLEASGNFISTHKWKLGAGALGAYLLAQTVAGAVGEAQDSAKSDEAFESRQEYVTALETAAVQQADVANIIGTPMQDLGNGETPRIYDQAMSQLESLGLNDADGINEESIDISAKAVSSLIHPDSIFVISQGNFDNNPATTEVIVQVAPDGYTLDSAQPSADSE